MSWLREHVDIPAGHSAREVAERLVRAGLEVEGIEPVGDVSGPVVVGQVLEFVEEPQKKKTIRWCQVRVAEGEEPRGIVCGASNFAVGDKVVVSLPGAVLHGGFAIAARKTYGHVSDGMICSSTELGVGDDGTEGIVVLPEDAPVGADAADYLKLRDEVLDITPTPDRGYALSVRGIARELAAAYSVPLRDPADVEPATSEGPAWPVRVEDGAACDRFVARGIVGLDPERPSPAWMTRRLALAGMRSVSLAVDVTNYVMLELGQPLHAYDMRRLQGAIVVRRALPDERIETLDGTKRALDPDDLVISDESGAIGVAGVMGGASTEISAATTDIVLEAAHFDAAVVSRGSRRHGLLSEASRRFERGVDPALPPVAAQRAVDLLVELGGATAEDGVTDAGTPVLPAQLRMPADLPGRVVGVGYTTDEVLAALRAVGCTVTAEGEDLLVTPPSWRGDLAGPYDLVEEVARLDGYDRIPSVLPLPPASAGLTEQQRARRRVGRALAGAGLVEAPSYPFIGEADLEALGLAADDPRRRTLHLANPISAEQPALRTTLLPGLLAALRRNVARGAVDVALFETGLVFRVDDGPLPQAPRLGVDARPSDEQLAALDAALPRQPRRVGAVLAGNLRRPGWWGPGEPALWADAIEAARTVASAVGVTLDVRADEHAPWHPGRCAALLVGGTVVGHAGELHPRVVEALGVPERTCAMELDLDLLMADLPGPVPAPRLSAYPVATQDVALVVDTTVPAAAVEAALRAGAGGLLEQVRLFDVYKGAGIAEGQRSLAYRLWLRAEDRTLTAEEASQARDAAVAEAGRRTGAVLRGA
nr:phenylalanine--tRNA ligase subunit beta [Motilibacter aurantiacus]